MHLQRNATQRIPQLYLNNNFKFYIFQFFRALEFLSGFIRFAKNQFEIISHYEDEVRSNPNFNKFNFYNLISLINKFYTKWIALLILFVRNDDKKINFNNVALAHCVNNSEKGITMQLHAMGFPHVRIAKTTLLLDIKEF